MKNVIILGSGRTGSSILAGLIFRNRYYINPDSIKARRHYPDGDYENYDLIRMNESILQEVGYNYGSLAPRKKVNVDHIEALAESGDIIKYREFIADCDKESPWLWKDPRLGYTIFFWKHLLDMDNIHFILITRDLYQVFRSFSKGGISRTKREIYQRHEYRLSLMENFIKENNLQVLRIDYSEIWDRDVLNNKLTPVLGVEISKEDYSSVIKKNIHKKEVKTVFLIRYYFGVFKLKLRRLIMT